MPDSNDGLSDASPEELRAVIEEQRRRLAFYAQILLAEGYDPDDLMGAVD